VIKLFNNNNIGGITCCFICSNPLIKGKSIKLWVGKGKYQYACTSCVTRQQDPDVIKLFKE